ncbi:MmpS family transport accessory protein [Mycobacterium ulcerans]|uniref:MmpS family transport accessory protein n=1 Tax=Mycobacterium ulcerans TaxID=1809 RepID=UPI001E2DFA23|nr:MmpS family transport accessory protein [Mycobacterium ulcerans]
MWVPIVMILVAIVGASVVMRLHGVFGSHRYVPDAGNSDAIVAFNPKYVRYEVFGPPRAPALLISRLVSWGIVD